MREVNPDEAVRSKHGEIPLGDVVLQVTVGDEVIARMDIYWHTITVGGDPLEIAWVDHLVVDPDYENLGFGSALFAAAAIIAGREREWGMGWSPASDWFEQHGWFRPDRSALIVGPLSGAPQEWPPGAINAAAPTLEG